GAIFNRNDGVKNKVEISPGEITVVADVNNAEVPRVGLTISGISRSSEATPTPIRLWAKPASNANPVLTSNADDGGKQTGTASQTSPLLVEDFKPPNVSETSFPCEKQRTEERQTAKRSPIARRTYFLLQARAIMSISTDTSRGRRATSTVERAGGAPLQ